MGEAVLAPEDALLDVVLLLAVFANGVLILAPLRSALRALRQQACQKELVGIVAPTYLMLGQSYMWAWYGHLVGLTDIAHFNTFGAGMCTMYIAGIALGIKQERSLVGLSVATLVVFSWSIFNRLPVQEQRAQVFAYSAILFSLFQSMPPMLQALEVVRIGSPEGFPLAMTALKCTSGLLWAQYAAIVRDDLYWLGNALSVSVGCAELALVAWVTVWALYSQRQHALAAKDRDIQDDFSCRDVPLMPRGLTSFFRSCSFARSVKSQKLCDGWLPQSYGGELRDYRTYPGAASRGVAAAVPRRDVQSLFQEADVSDVDVEDCNQARPRDNSSVSLDDSAMAEPALGVPQCVL